VHNNARRYTLYTFAPTREQCDGFEDEIVDSIHYTVYFYNIYLPACPILGHVLSRLVVVLYYRGGVCDLSLCRCREICKSASVLAPFLFKKNDNVKSIQGTRALARR